MTQGAAPARSGERRLLALGLRAMAAVAALAGLVLAWRYAGGPPAPDGAPGVRVVKLLPGTFMWAEAPADPRYLPRGLHPSQAARVRLLLLRTEGGRLQAFFVPWQDGRAAVPVDASPAAPGLPCLDFAPSFTSQDIACRQSASGFAFAERHRWTLAGRALTPGTPDLTPARGQEHDGDWRPQLLTLE